MLLLLLWLCSAGCVAAAAALIVRLERAEKLVLACLCALFAASAVLSPNSYVNDHLWHFLNARAVLEDPARLLSTWDRPAFMLLYATPARLGLTAARLMSLAPAAIAIAGTMLAARALAGFPPAAAPPALSARFASEPPVPSLDKALFAERSVPGRSLPATPSSLPGMRPWLVGILVASQLDFFGQASSTMTELLFAAGFAVAIWGYASERPWLAAAGLGAVSVSRPEGPVFAALGAAGLWLRYRRLGPCALSLAPFLAYLGAGAVTLHDALWYLHENAYRNASDGARLRLEWKQLRESFFYTALLDSQPAALLAFEAVGVAAVVRRAGRRSLFLLAPLALSWLLLTFLRIGAADWWRQSRYLVALAPALALLAAAGLSWAMELLPAASPAVILLGAGASAAATMMERRRLPVEWGATGVLAAFALLVTAGFLLWLARRRVPFPISLAALLVLPLAASPPGSFARHQPTAGERLDLAAVRWLVDRRPAPVAVGWDSPALRTVCLYEVREPCPLPLRAVSLQDARPGSMFVRQFADGAPEHPPPGWRVAWSAEDGSVRGPQLKPRWAPVRAVIWEKL